MYFPYLRGKIFELEALLQAPTAVYKNTLPILEPVNVSRPKLFEQLAKGNIPLVLIMNPYYPVGSTMTTADVQNLIDNELAGHSSLLLGFIIDSRFNVGNLNSFLKANPHIKKVLIFRNNPLAADIVAIQTSIGKHPVEYVVFDESKTNAVTRNAFATHRKKVLLTDGFQRQDANINYPTVSTFTSNYGTFKANGWVGIGDYLTIGDHFQPGGGPVYVVGLHVTITSPQGLVVYHFTSKSNQKIKGLGPQKFAEANRYLVTSAITKPLTTIGIEFFRDWHKRKHNPQLGAAKKASIIHHIETVSALV